MKIHPIRATLAIALVLATCYFKYAGIELGPEWWGLLGVVTTFYFTSTREA